MGFLDHSSSNIIVDAVLTDIGRQFLANNDGSFKISYFAFADDEIDYSLIKKFGITIGKEKIEKNTPIFEAQTSANLALKYSCITAESPDLTRLPRIGLAESLDPAASVTIELNSDGARVTKSFSQKFYVDSDKDASLIDTRFTVKIPNMFVTLVGLTPDYVDREGIAYYSVNAVVPSTSATSSDAIATFTVQRRSITASQFTIYGSGTTINLVGSVIGNNSGATKLFKILITKTT